MTVPAKGGKGERTHSLLAALPPALAAGAYIAGNGEPLWSETEAVELVAWAAGRSLAITVGEVYWATGPMQTSFLGDWETRREPDEAWDAFTAAAAARARDEIARAVLLEPSGRLRFFLVLAPAPADR